MQTQTEMNLFRFLNKLLSLNLNTPEVICHLPKPETLEQAAKFDAVLNGICTAIRKKKPNCILRYIPDERFEILTWLNTVEKVKKHSYDNEFLLLKGPIGNVIFDGYMKISDISNTYVFDDEDLPVYMLYWNDKAKSPNAELNRFMYETNQMLYSIREKLDGYRIRFSLYDKGVGMLSHKLLFWGL